MPSTAKIRAACIVMAALSMMFRAGESSAQAGAPADRTLEAVAVTASRADTRLEDMPLHTTVISQEDLQRSPADTLDQVLRNVPGLLIPGSPAYVSDPTGQNIKFRGMEIGRAHV